VPNIGVLLEPEAAGVMAVDEVALDGEVETRLLLHPAATRPATSSTNKPDRPVTRRMDTPLWVDSPVSLTAEDLTRCQMVLLRITP
jgi:hypothetical protein